MIGVIQEVLSWLTDAGNMGRREILQQNRTNKGVHQCNTKVLVLRRESVVRRSDRQRGLLGECALQSLSMRRVGRESHGPSGEEDQKSLQRIASFQICLHSRVQETKESYS